MTRIFDALKKAGAHRPAYPAAVGPTPPPASSGYPVYPANLPRAAAPAGTGASRAPLPFALPLEQVTATELPEAAGREMTTLRIGIEAALDERGTRVVMFMSSQGGEGTSTVAAQFALMLANDNRVRTILVDAHARRPVVGLRLATPVLVGASRAKVPARADQSAESELSILRAPEEAVRTGIFSPPTARDLIASLTGQFDWIILDGPPVLEAPEGVELATLADGVVIVVQAGGVKKPVVSRAVELLRKAGVRVMGSVLNRRRLEIPEFIYRRI